MRPTGGRSRQRVCAARLWAGTAGQPAGADGQPAGTAGQPVGADGQPAGAMPRTTIGQTSHSHRPTLPPLCRTRTADGWRPGFGDRQAAAGAPGWGAPGWGAPGSPHARLGRAGLEHASGAPGSSAPAPAVPIACAPRCSFRRSMNSKSAGGGSAEKGGPCRGPCPAGCPARGLQRGGAAARPSEWGGAKRLRPGRADGAGAARGCAGDDLFIDGAKGGWDGGGAAPRPLCTYAGRGSPAAAPAVRRARCARTRDVGHPAPRSRRAPCRRPIRRPPVP